MVVQLADSACVYIGVEWNGFYESRRSNEYVNGSYPYK